MVKGKLARQPWGPRPSMSMRGRIAFLQRIDVYKTGLKQINA
jgi:hypothetical protein